MGGLVGWNKGIVTNSFAEGNKRRNTYRRLCGKSNFGSIYLSHSTGHVTAGIYRRRIRRQQRYGRRGGNCYSTGNVIAITPTAAPISEALPGQLPVK